MYRLGCLSKGAVAAALYKYRVGILLTYYMTVAGMVGYLRRVSGRMNGFIGGLVGVGMGFVVLYLVVNDMLLHCNL